jgi:hypothetical protein
MAKNVPLENPNDVIKVGAQEVTRRVGGAGSQSGELYRNWNQGTNPDGTYGKVNWLQGDEIKFKEVQNEFFNEFPGMEQGFDPGNPEHVGLFQNWHNEKAKELGQDQYFRGSTKPGTGGYGTDNMFGKHTYNAWDTQDKAMDLPKPPLMEPPVTDPDLKSIEEPIEKWKGPVLDGTGKNYYRPRMPETIEPSTMDPTKVELQGNYTPEKIPSPELPPADYKPDDQSFVAGDSVGNNLADLALGAVGGYFSDHGDKWKMYRGKFGEEALNKAVGYRSELEAKNAMNPYETSSQMRDVDLAQQGALLSTQRNMVNKNMGTQGDVGGNLGTGAALAAAYGATSPYVQQKTAIQQQGLQRGDQLTGQTNALNDQIAHTEYDITDFRDKSKNYMKMLEQGLNTYNKVKGLYGNKPETIYENNRQRTGK